jgi:hypothetical protein
VRPRPARADRLVSAVAALRETSVVVVALNLPG